jgi:hypothetical protein
MRAWRYGQRCGECTEARRATVATDWGYYVCPPCAETLADIGDRPDDDDPLQWDGQD